MKIFVNARFLNQPVSGVQRYAIECSRQIKKLSPEVVFLSPPDILHHDIAEELGVSVIGRRSGHRWEQIELPLFMARQKSAPLLNLANTAPLFYSNNYVTIHDLAFYHHPEWNSKKFSAWYNILIPRIAMRSRHIFTVSNTVKDELVKYYNLKPEKISVTFNGVSRAMLSGGNSPEMPKEKIILAVGTFNKRKNHQNLIVAWKIAQLYDRYKLIIIGDKNKVFTETGIDESQLTDCNIQVIPTLSESELIDMYHKAEILVSLSLYEGFGIPILEGLYNRCKVVCSDIPVYRELYTGYVTFCDPADINNVAMAITKTVANAKNTDSPNIDLLLEKYNYTEAANTIFNRIEVHK